MFMFVLCCLIAVVMAIGQYLRAGRSATPAEQRQVRIVVLRTRPARRPRVRRRDDDIHWV